MELTNRERPMGLAMTGGISTVHRRGAVVDRPAGPHTPSVHRFLWHLHRRGFRQCPRPVGLDPVAGIETVTFLPGRVDHEPAHPLPDRIISSAARLLARLHRAAADFPIHPDDRWDLPVRGRPELLVHGDVALYNCVVRHGVVAGLFDFDTVHPGPRLWDVGYAAYRFAGLGAADDGAGPTPEQQRRSMELFCRAYGTDDLVAVVDGAARRLLALVDLIEERAAAGHPAFLRHRAEGHPARYLADIDRLRADRAFLSGAEQTWRPRPPAARPDPLGLTGSPLDHDRPEGRPAPAISPGRTPPGPGPKPRPVPTSR